MKKVFSLRALVEDCLAIGFKAGAVEAVSNPNFWGVQVEGFTPSQLQSVDIMFSPDWLINVPDNYVPQPVDQKALAKEFGIGTTDKKAQGLSLSDLLDGLSLEDVGEIFGMLDEVLAPTVEVEVAKHASEFKFKVGDKVRLVGEDYTFNGEVVTITELTYGKRPLYYFEYPKKPNRLHGKGWWLADQTKIEAVTPEAPKQGEAPKKISSLAMELLKIFGDMGEVAKQER